MQERSPLARYGETGLRVPASAQDVLVRAELHVPLIQSDRHVGVVSLGRVRDEPFRRGRARDHLALAGPAAIALSNVRALQVARHQARSTAPSSTPPTRRSWPWTTRVRSRVELVRRAAVRLAREEAIGRPVADLIVPPDASA